MLDKLAQILVIGASYQRIAVSISSVSEDESSMYGWVIQTFSLIGIALMAVRGVAVRGVAGAISG